MSVTSDLNEDLSHPTVEAGLEKKHIQLGFEHVFACGCLALLFGYFNFIPLYHTDLWGHVAYGDWIIQNQQLPTEDPFLSLAEGVPIIASAWLGQVLFSVTERWAGLEGLSTLFAVVMTSTLLILYFSFYQQTRRVGLSTLVVLFCLFLGSTRIAIIRTEIFGSFSLALLLLTITFSEQLHAPKTQLLKKLKSPWVLYPAVFLIFWFWANAHGSFIIGMAVTGCHLLGRSLEVLWKQKSLVSVIKDPGVRKWLIVNEIAVAASLLNPYGIDLLLNAFMFPSNPNLADITEWYAMETTHAEGILFAFSWIVLVFLVRHSRRTIRPVDVLLLAVFSFSYLSRVRMANWYAIIFCYTMAPHFKNVLERIEQSLLPYFHHRFPKLSSRAASKSQLCTIFCLVVLWFGFVLSPSSTPLLNGTPRPTETILSKETPQGVTHFFRNHPPPGQIWNPQWWGDWLAWDGPKGLNVFMTTNAAHVAPNRTWKDYLGIARGQRGWREAINRYNVNTIVLQKSLQRQLEREVRRLDDEWNIVFEDQYALVVTRDSSFLESVNKSRAEKKPSSTTEAVAPQQPTTQQNNS